MSGAADSTSPKCLIDYLRLATEHLRAKGIDSHRLDAELLMAEALGASRVELYTSHERPLTREEVDRFRELLRRRAAREPIAYILGKREFWSLDLLVDRRVLIPRPETETLVETAVRACKGQLGRPSEPTRYDDSAGDPALPVGEGAPASPTEAALVTKKVLDIGTGSGAIAVALAKELPGLSLVASDDSAASLEVAPKNAERHGVADRIDFRCGDLFASVDDDEIFDVIVSNPPYCKDGELAAMEPEVRDWEPRGALLAGPDGMRETARIIAGAACHLSAQGWLILEVGTQAQAVRDELARGGWRDIRSVLDLAGRERVLAARPPLSTHASEGEAG